MIQENVYTCFANGCLLLTAYMKANGQKGWSSMLINDEGQPILNSTDQASIEKMFASAPWLLSFLKAKPAVQVGGGGGGVGDEGFADTMSRFVNELTGDDVSLDSMMNAFIAKFQEMDDYWKEMPFVKRMLNTDSEIYLPTTPYGAPYVTVPIPRRPFLLFLMTLLDSFRLSRALMGEKDVSLTLIVLFEELLTGQWRQMILTAAGLLSPSGVAMGVMGKYIINTWSLIDGNVRTDIVKSFFKGGKSLFIGFMLWCVTTLPPQSYKDAYKKKIDEFKDLQQKAQNPAFVCTPAVGEIIKSIEDDPFFRLLMEMLNVPVVKEDRLKACKNVATFEMPFDPADITETLGQTKSLVANAKGAVTGVIGDAKGAVTGAVENAKGAVTGVIGEAQGAVTGAIGDAKGAVTGAIGEAQGAVTGAIGEAQGAVQGVIGEAHGAVTGAIGEAKGAVTGVIGEAKGAVANAKGAVANAKGAIQKTIGTMVGGKRRTRKRHST